MNQLLGGRGEVVLNDDVDRWKENVDFDLDATAQDAMTAAGVSPTLILLPSPWASGPRAKPHMAATYEVYLQTIMSFDRRQPYDVSEAATYQGITHELGHYKSASDRFKMQFQHELGMRYPRFKKEYLAAECESTLEDVSIDADHGPGDERYAVGFLANTILSTINDGLLLRHVNVEKNRSQYVVRGIGKMEYVQCILRLIRRKVIAHLLKPHERSGTASSIPFGMFRGNMEQQLDHYVQNSVVRWGDLRDTIQRAKSGLLAYAEGRQDAPDIQADLELLLRGCSYPDETPPIYKVRAKSQREFAEAGYERAPVKREYPLSGILLDHVFAA